MFIWKVTELLPAAADPLYDFLKSQQGGLLTSDVKWNFTKFLIGKDGEVRKRWACSTCLFAQNVNASFEGSSAASVIPVLAACVAPRITKDAVTYLMYVSAHACTVLYRYGSVTTPSSIESDIKNALAA